MSYPKSKFPYAVKNLKNTLKILKKIYIIPFENIIFPFSRQKDLNIYRTMRLIFVCSIGRTACPNLSQYERSTFVKCGSPKMLFIIISRSRNVKQRSLLSSTRIELTDSYITTFGQPVRHSSC